MSGKRHHYIPRFLQNGFSSHSVNDQYFSWVYRKNSAPFNTNIINIGVEGLFYTQENNSTLDDKITTAEGALSALVYELRNNELDILQNKDAIINLLVHLELRTRHLRHSLALTGTALIEEFLKFLEKDENITSYVRGKFKRHPHIIHEIMIEELKKNNIPLSLLPHLMQKSEIFLDQALPATINKFKIELPSYRKSLQKKLTSGAKFGHIKLLNDDASYYIKTHLFQHLNFKVYTNTKERFPLGDAPVLFEFHGEKGFKPFSDKNDLIKCVYLPLAPHTILIGAGQGEQPDLRLIPLKIAQCSLEYFISDKCTKETADLHKHISEQACILSENEITSIIDDVINE